MLRIAPSSQGKFGIVLYPTGADDTSNQQRRPPADIAILSAIFTPGASNSTSTNGRYLCSITTYSYR